MLSYEIEVLPSANVLVESRISRLVRSCSNRLAWIALFLIPWTLSAAYADDSYQLGHGLDVGPFNIAGYSNLVANFPNQGSKSLTLDDLSLFASGHIDKMVNPFTEAELTHLNFVRWGSKGADNGKGEFALERLYNDSYLTNAFTLRLGKMLAPVGEWNEIHAAPLVLSAVRPAVTDRNFSEYATGAALQYSDPDGHLPDIKVYWQPTGELSERPTNITYHQYRSVEGAHVSFPIGLLDKVGASFQQSKDVKGANQSLYGLDYRYSVEKFSFEGEATYSDVSHNETVPGHDTEWGLYTAASYALTDTWSAYAWYEGFADRTAPSAAQDLLFGLAYRPRPAIVFHLEYVQNVGGQPVNPTGIFASWSVLF